MLVTTTGNVQFRGALSDLTASWTGLDLESASNISFHGGTGSDQLTQLVDMTARGFRSNLLTGLPTDCPTREKHAWLGDTLNIAAGAAYTYWIPSILEAFLDTIAAA